MPLSEITEEKLIQYFRLTLSEPYNKDETLKLSLDNFLKEFQDNFIVPNLNFVLLNPIMPIYPAMLQVLINAFAMGYLYKERELDLKQIERDMDLQAWAGGKVK